MIIDIEGFLGGLLLPAAFLAGLFASIKPSLKFSFREHLDLFRSGRKGLHFPISFVLGVVMSCVFFALLIAALVRKLFSN